MSRSSLKGSSASNLASANQPAHQAGPRQRRHTTLHPETSHDRRSSKVGVMARVSTVGKNMAARRSMRRTAKPEAATPPPAVAKPEAVKVPDPDGKVELPDSVKGMLKPYNGDLFGSSSKNYAAGLLYLSRMNPDAELHHTQNKWYTNKDESIKQNVEQCLPIQEEELSEELRQQRVQKLRRFAISLATLSARVEERFDLVKNGSAKALLTLSTEEDAITKMACAMALRNLTEQPDHRAAILDAGCVASLVALSQAPSEAIQEHCAVALVNLSVVKGGEGQVVSAVGALLAMSTQSVALMEIILLALCNLSCVEECYHRIEDLNSAVLQVANFALSPKLEYMLLGCLGNLSCLKLNQSRLVEEGAVRVVVQIIGDWTTKKKQEEETSKDVTPTVRLCATTLANLASCSRSRSKMTGQAVIRSLLAMTASEDEGIKQECALTIARLAGDPGCCEKIVSHGAVAVVVAMSRRLNLDRSTGRICAAALRKLLVIGFENELFANFEREEILEAIKAVVHIVLISLEDQRTNQDCSKTLCVLFRRKELVGDMFVEGAFDALVRLSLYGTSGDIVVATWCSRAFYTLSCDAYLALRMLDNAGTAQKALCSLCTSQSESIRRRSAATLWNLTRADDDSLDADTLIPSLIALLSSSSSSSSTRKEAVVVVEEEEEEPPENMLLLMSPRLKKGTTNSAAALKRRQEKSQSNTKAYAIGALAQLACSFGNCKAMLDSGALLPIVELTRSGDYATKVQCGAILSRFSFQASSRAHMLADERVSKSFMEALLDLSALDHLATQRRFVAGVVNMSYEPRARRLMRDLSNNLIKVLVDLSNKPDESIRRGCAAAICNLTADSGFESQVLQAKAVPALLIIALVSSDRPETKEICASALCNIMHDEATHGQMVADGLLWGLSKLGLALVKLEDVKITGGEKQLKQQLEVQSPMSKSQKKKEKRRNSFTNLPKNHKKLLENLHPENLVLRAGKQKRRSSFADQLEEEAQREVDEANIVEEDDSEESNQLLDLCGGMGGMRRTLRASILRLKKQNSKFVPMPESSSVDDDKEQDEVLLLEKEEDLSEGAIFGPQTLGYHQRVVVVDVSEEANNITHRMDLVIAPAMANLAPKYAGQLVALPAAMSLFEAMLRPTHDLDARRPSARAVVQLIMELPKLVKEHATKKAGEKPFDVDSIRRRLLRMTERMTGDEDMNRSRLYALTLLSIQAPGLLLAKGSVFTPPLVCTSPETSLAYVHLVTNLCRCPETPTELLAELLGRLSELDRSRRVNNISRSAHDAAFDLELARCLYWASQQAALAPFLVGKPCRVLEILKAACANPSQRVRCMLRPFWVTTLHNLSCFECVHAPMVEGGAIGLVHSAFPELDAELRLLGALMTCNLATGLVNSARVVADKGTVVIIAHLAPGGGTTAHSKRCAAAALRNLLRVGANQLPMAIDGVIEALVDLANKSDPADLRTNQHCASALRTLTYNSKTREMLVKQTGAIGVILAESALEATTKPGPASPKNNSGFSCSHELLCKVESESWKNGARGPQEPRTRLPEPSLVQRNPLLEAHVPTLIFQVPKSTPKKKPADIGLVDNSQVDAVDDDDDDDDSGSSDVGGQDEDEDEDEAIDDGCNSIEDEISNAVHTAYQKKIKNETLREEEQDDAEAEKRREQNPLIEGRRNCCLYSKQEFANHLKTPESELTAGAPELRPELAEEEHKEEEEEEEEEDEEEEEELMGLRDSISAPSLEGSFSRGSYNSLPDRNNLRRGSTSFDEKLLSSRTAALLFGDGEKSRFGEEESPLNRRKTLNEKRNTVNLGSLPKSSLRNISTAPSRRSCTFQVRRNSLASLNHSEPTRSTFSSTSSTSSTNSSPPASAKKRGKSMKVDRSPD